MSSLPMLTILIPLIGALAIAAARRRPDLRESITFFTALVLFGTVLSMVAPLLDGQEIYFKLIDVVPSMSIAFRVEPLGMIYALIASGLWILNSLYSVGYMRANGEKHQTRFYVCFALSLSGAMGIAFAENLFTLFIFYEMLTLSTFPLVTHKGSPEAVRSGRVYLGILVSTSVGLLFPAMVWIYTQTGNLSFQPGGVFKDAIGENGFGQGQIALLFAMCVFGIGKAAIMPIHRWLPAAMVAPTPVSALLHAVAVVKAGVFSITKIAIHLFGWDTLTKYGSASWLVYLSGFTILSASVIALQQDNLKRRLAYSTVSQLSYILLAVGLWALIDPSESSSRFAITAAGMHIAVHAFGKITLFFAAGSIYTASHKTRISELDGIGFKMPITMTAFALGSISMIGIPPAAGFLSKWYLMIGAWEAHHWFAIFVLLVSTLLNAGYYLPIIWRAFFCAAPDESNFGNIQEAPWPMVVALSVTAGGVLFIFFQPGVFLELATLLAAAP
ncbi:MAG TPA: monovalent cation/H+ antiporter subunit D family protein [Verrucomicrobiales bacterium]|nr:monovalent cation/H+ antiporter subunit D family protein [Verrucomicrobiales bacterium]HIL70973.1 monovalent cation/H+ antiporter subunit D family protein [Verrucomicrobiota bacterium]